MFIAVNKFRIKSEMADSFEKVWKERQSFLSEMPGFVRFWLLKSEQPEYAEFLSHSQWVNREAFDGWRKSEQMSKAHSGSSPVGPMMMGPPEFRGYETVLDEVPGHRTDYRSVFMDQKVEKNFTHETPLQQAIALENQKQKLPSINIGAFEGQLLMLWLKSLQARVGVEVGSLGGYSASWLLRGMNKGGKLYTLELENERAEFVRKHFQGSEFESQLDVIAGPALETLNGALKDLHDLDFVFIDADKKSYSAYVEWAKPRLRRGGMIFLDNAYIWGGMNYWKETWEHPSPQTWDSFQNGAFVGMTKSWELLNSDPDFSALVLPTGEGMLVAIKN